MLGVVKVEEFTLETPPSHEEKDLMTIEQFLGCAKLAVLILNNYMLA